MCVLVQRVSKSHFTCPLSASATEQAGERCVCVCQCGKSALADVDWQEGAAGMCLAAALSAGQVQTALSSHERVIVTGKSLHDQKEPSLCQICTALENFGRRRRKSTKARE